MMRFVEIMMSVCCPWLVNHHWSQDSDILWLQHVLWAELRTYPYYENKSIPYLKVFSVSYSLRDKIQAP